MGERRSCSFPDCGKPQKARALCGSHYSQLLRGTPLKATTPRGTVAERLWRRVYKSESCWVWLGATDRHGYGHLSVNWRTVFAHRLSWELAHGPIPAGKVIDHHCHNPPCVRPAHLRVVTQKQNRENLRLSPLNKSGYRGVSRNKRTGKWVATVVHEQVQHYAGSFERVEDAAIAATDMRNKLFSNNPLDRIKS